MGSCPRERAGSCSTRWKPRGRKAPSSAVTRAGRARATRASQEVGISIGVMQPGQPGVHVSRGGRTGELPRACRRGDPDHRGRGTAAAGLGLRPLPGLGEARDRRGRVGAARRARRRCPATGPGLVYPVDATALKHGAGVTQETKDGDGGLRRHGGGRADPVRGRRAPRRRGRCGSDACGGSRRPCCCLRSSGSPSWSTAS